MYSGDAAKLDDGVDGAYSVAAAWLDSVEGLYSGGLDGV